jgi:hypothetical protein
MRFRNFLFFLAFVSASCFANVIDVGGPLTISSLSTTGVSFTYSGTLTDSDILNITQSGDPCLQNSPVGYCTNGAGVVTTAGTSPVGADSSFVGMFNGVTSTWVYGSILIEISGEGTQELFVANPASGLGSATPPLSLSTSTSLSSLGFGSFSVSDPTITFVLADSLYTDNSGSFVLTQTPEPSTLLLVAPLLLGFAWFRRRAQA